MNKIAEKLFGVQCRYREGGEENREFYEYAYRLLLNRCLVYLIIVVTGIWMRTLAEMFVFLLTFISLRQYASGIHMKKAETCIVTSVLLVCLAGWLSKVNPKPTMIFTIVWAAACIGIFILSPVGCKNKELDAMEESVYGRKSKIILAIQIVLIGVFEILGFQWIAKGGMLAQINICIGLVGAKRKLKELVN